MSQKFEECIQPLYVNWKDVGLDCNCTIYGIDEEKVIDSIIIHMFEYYAIMPNEMTTCMRLKIKENVHVRTLLSST